MSDTGHDPLFTEQRPQLIRLAYRMLGSVADAEDVVQDAYMRWLDVKREAVSEPKAYLRTIVARLCLNVLKSARRKRETYIGPWLPEPVFDPEDEDIADDITLPLMMALERLSPLERTAFLLHDIFAVGYGEIADTLGREEAACRKLASRAREHIHAARQRFAVDRKEGRRLAEAFFQASRTGDLDALRELLREDATAYSDGGGKVAASLRPIVGIDDVMRRFAQLAILFRKQPSRLVRYASIDGLPGFVTVEGGDILQTTALQIEEGAVSAVFVLRNPDKLISLQRSLAQQT